MLQTLRTVHEMIGERGYVPRKKYEWIDDSKKMLQKVQNNYMVLWADRKTPEDSLMVFFSFEPKLNVQKAREFIETLEESKVHHAIVVHYIVFH